MEKMDFDSVVVDKIWRLVANNWYYILINGQVHGFFQSSRGVNQGDPLSPALFILTTEVLTRALNSLFNNEAYMSYGLPKWSDNINHLAYADDTIIFTSVDGKSLNILMQILKDYEAQSGHMINKEKSSFFVYHKTTQNLIKEIEVKTAFAKGLQEETGTGWLGVTSITKKKVDWVLDPSLMYLRLFLQNCGGLSEQKNPYGLTLCGISTVKGEGPVGGMERDTHLEEVSQCFTHGERNYDMLHVNFEEEISNHIIQQLSWMKGILFKGDLIYAEGKRIGIANNLVAEVVAWRMGKEYSRVNNLFPLTLETDSQVVKNMVDGSWDIPSEVSLEIRIIQELMKGMEVPR
ncbi:hypothetical protein MTR67_044186 [Solanum verrucosum]|uniref:Reverse transcriptase domain-containing protein n=1 Tax=Solanum verrucosum TaxID=315347 RepID=A0AAF0UTF4_SOLVR|nr:hypothetical protein MTR67_044186 [Solanum verrucosum]